MAILGGAGPLPFLGVWQTLFLYDIVLTSVELRSVIYFVSNWYTSSTYLPHVQLFVGVYNQAYILVVLVNTILLQP